MTNSSNKNGGYQNLLTYQNATIIYDFTVEFCNKYMSYKTNQSYRTYDQMVQAARSGKQNIAEGSAGRSVSTDLKLTDVAKTSLKELLEDYQDFLRQHGLVQWDKDSTQARVVRELAYKSNRSYKTYESYMEAPETAANAMLCLINQTTYLLDKQWAALEKKFIAEGGFTENLHKKRLEARKKQGYQS